MMTVGLIGLGKMGANLALNMTEKGNRVIGFDIDEGKVREARKSGIETASSQEELVGKLEGQRILWLMVPAGQAVDAALGRLSPLLRKGDIVIDGGNSFYRDSIRRYRQMKESGVGYLDAGISGGMEGARGGVCSMVGGDKDVYDRAAQLFRQISVEDGALYTGPAGSGHFSKMIHNGIEYGMLQAIGEGFEILEASDYDYDYARLAKLWNHGSVIRGWLMSLAEDAFRKDSRLGGIRGVMNSNGEGLWSAQTALELKVPAPVITASVIMRHRSQQEDSFSGKVVAALRNEFGGHEVEKKRP